MVANLLGGIVFLLILVVIFFISKQNAASKEKIRQMEVEREANIKPQIRLDELVVTAEPEPTEDPAPGDTKVSTARVEKPKVQDKCGRSPFDPDNGKPCSVDTPSANLIEFGSLPPAPAPAPAPAQSPPAPAPAPSPPAPAPAPAPAPSPPAPAPAPDVLLWGIVKKKDLSGGGFHLHKNSSPKLEGTKAERTKICTDKCADQSDCKAVVFDTRHNLCWAKRSIHKSNEKTASNREYFYKCEAGNTDCKTIEELLKPPPATALTTTTQAPAPAPPTDGCMFEPFNTKKTYVGTHSDNYVNYCKDLINTKTSDCRKKLCTTTQAKSACKEECVNPTPAPAPVTSSEPSTNGRCGSSGNNNKRCPGRQCCSNSNWCGGTQGTRSAWCNGSGNKGGISRYDGQG